MDIEGQNLKMTIKWGKTTLEVESCDSDTLETFKAQLYSLTQVLPEKQKLMCKGKFLKEDNKTLKDLSVTDVSSSESSNYLNGPSRR